MTPQERERHRLPADVDYTDALRELVVRINGFVYYGESTEAVIDTIRILRADPALAKKLLAQ